MAEYISDDASYSIDKSENGFDSSSENKKSEGDSKAEGVESISIEMLCTTAEEAAQLRALRAELCDELRDAPAFPELTGNDRLLRFLRKCGAVEPAAERYRAMLEYRRKWGVDEVRREIVSGNLTLSDFPHAEVICSLMPMRHNIAEGELVQMQMNGIWETQRLVEIVRAGELSEKQFLTYWMYYNEFLALQLHALSRASGELAMLKQVCNFEGAGFNIIYPPFYAFATPWIKSTQRNYPHTSACIDFLHPPVYLSALFKLLRPLFDPDTFEKMKVVPQSAESRYDSVLAETYLRIPIFAYSP